MSFVPAAAAAVVGVTFVVAGASKLANRNAWIVQARGLGAPEWAIAPAPWFELVVGALLVAQVARRVTAVVAIVLLMVFTIMILAKLRRGERPPCACFGAWSSKPIGAGHVVRNLALTVLAAVAVAG